MGRNDGVINHPFRIKQDLPWKHIMGCAEGLFDKRSLVKRCEKTNFESIADFQVIHTQWGRVCGFRFHVDARLVPFSPGWQEWHPWKGHPPTE